MRTWRICDVGQRAARFSPCRRPRLDRTNTATGRRRGSRKAFVSAFEARGAYPARVSHNEVAADGPRSTHAQRGLGMVEVRASAWRAPPHAVDRDSTALTWRKVGGGGIERFKTYDRAPHRREASLLRCRTLLRRSGYGLQCAAGFRMAHANKRHCASCLSGGGETRELAARPQCCTGCDRSTCYERALHRRKASLFRCKTVVRHTSCGLQRTAGNHVARTQAPLRWLSLGRL